jgi:hypothetical protein
LTTKAGRIGRARLAISVTGGFGYYLQRKGSRASLRKLKKGYVRYFADNGFEVDQVWHWVPSESMIPGEPPVKTPMLR